MWLSRLDLFEGLIWTEIQMPVDSTGVRNSTHRGLCATAAWWKCLFLGQTLLPDSWEAACGQSVLYREILKVFKGQQMYCYIFYGGWDCLGRYLFIPVITDHCPHWAHLAAWQEHGINSWRNDRPLHSSLLFASSDKCKSNYIYTPIWNS